MTRGPNKAADGHFPDMGMVGKFLGGMAKSAVEDPPLAPLLGPDDGHGARAAFIGVGGFSENLDRGIDHHVILFRVVGEFGRHACGDGLFVSCQSDGVIADVGVAHKMAPDHPFVFKIAPEGIAHAAMNASQATSCANGGLQTFALWIGESAHGPAGEDQVKGGKRGIGKDIKGFLNADIETVGS